MSEEKPLQPGEEVVVYGRAFLEPHVPLYLMRVKRVLKTRVEFTHQDVEVVYKKSAHTLFPHNVFRATAEHREALHRRALIEKLGVIDRNFLRKLETATLESAVAAFGAAFGEALR